MRGKAIAAGAVATLAVVAGVTYWAVSGDDEPFTVSGYKAMCKKPREYAEAAPHAGSGPRPVYIDGFWPLTDTDAKELNATERRTWSPKEPAKVQLIACVDHLGQGDFLRSCDYDSLLGSSGGEPFTLHLYKGKYEVTVYEARSGKPLGSTEIQGDAIFGTEDRPCPGTAVKPDNPRDNAKEGRPRPAQLREVLRPYVNGG
ncbi:hypothetical protein ACFWRX_24805 [Streptomyces albidoflavus]